jgi:hypothetical protein
MWWIVLNPVGVGGGLNGVLIDHEGTQRGVLMGVSEETVVRELAEHADPTVDVSVAHGWAQAPEELHAAYEAKRAPRRPTVLRRIEEQG